MHFKLHQLAMQTTYIEQTNVSNMGMQQESATAIQLQLTENQAII